MECSVCRLRSSVGFCGECRILLCEVCRILCENCGKTVCARHVHETGSGRQLCAACYQERQASRAAPSRPASARVSGSAGSTSFAALAGLSDEAEAEEGVREEALTASGYTPTPPWKLSLYGTVAGLVGVSFVLFFPSIWRVFMPFESSPARPYLLVLIPLAPAVIGVFWAAFGMRSSTYFADRLRCATSIGIAVLAVVLAFVAAGQARQDFLARTAPLLERMRRPDMAPHELERWRLERLRKYSR